MSGSSGVYYMVFKVAQAVCKNGRDLVTGYFSATNAEEQELIGVMIEVFGEVPTYNNKFYTDGKRILFKSVELELLKENLNYISRELVVPITFQANKHFTGNRDILSKL